MHSWTQTLRILLALIYLNVIRALEDPCPPPPTVLLYKIDSNNTKIDDSQGTTLSFEIMEDNQPQFLLYCEHNIPIRWILDEDFDAGELSQPQAPPTIRRSLKPEDLSTYTYLAKYYLRLQKPSDNHIFICQPFSSSPGNNCSSTTSRTVVLAELGRSFINSRAKSLRLSVLSLKEMENPGIVPALFEFDEKYKNRAGGILNDDSASCPFNLTIGITDPYIDIGVKWGATSGSSGNEDIHSVATRQAMENADLFYPPLAEGCVTYVDSNEEIEKCCKAVSFDYHQFYPQVLSYTLGDERRVLKTFFDLAEPRSLYFSWEEADPQQLMYGKVEVPKAYKNQNFSVRCNPSVYLFSVGTQIGWKLKSEGQDDFRMLNNLTEPEEPNWGVWEVRGHLMITEDDLPENTTGPWVVEVLCMSPVWNTADWVNYTYKFNLLDSTPPQVSPLNPEDVDNDINVDNTGPIPIYEVKEGQTNFSISCEVSGIPQPEVEFISPRKNLDLNHTLTPLENGTVLLTLEFGQITDVFEGTYTCLAKSILGEAKQEYSLKLRRLLPQFLITILSIGGFLLLLFLLGSTLLLLKLRRERAEFLKATEDVIKKFQDGFQTSQDELGFTANSEYKEYEIPISRWGLGSTLLGSGAFGVVQKGVIYFASNKQDVVAVKTVNSPKDVKDFENALMELTIMSYIGKHEHVVSLIGACTDNIGKRSILIGVEYCANGDLLNYVKKRRSIFRTFVSSEDGRITLDSITGRYSYTNIANFSGTFTSLDQYKWAYQIASGMDYLGSKKILHADLAARNVLLTSDKIAKISDFGLSRQLIMSDNYTKKTNTPLPWRWMSIESLKYRQFSASSDVWGYGVTLYEIFSLGEEPWSGYSWTNEFMDDLEKGKRLGRPKFATLNMYNKIMLECWRNEPNERLTFSQAREFFQTAIGNLNSPEGKEDEVLNNLC